MRNRSLHMRYSNYVLKYIHICIYIYVYAYIFCDLRYILRILLCFLRLFYVGDEQSEIKVCFHLLYVIVTISFR